MYEYNSPFRGVHLPLNYEKSTFIKVYSWKSPNVFKLHPFSFTLAFSLPLVVWHRDLIPSISVTRGGCWGLAPLKQIIITRFTNKYQVGI